MGVEKASIQKLEQRAKHILELRNNLGSRRPLVIEFCGTPKAGKTTTINALNIFLKRNEFKTIVIHEMAGVCPVISKTDFHFNSWTIFSSMAELIKQQSFGAESKVDIILIDRNIFDATCWFHWLNTNPNKKDKYISDSQYKSFLDFFVNSEMWVRNTDFVYVFKTTPEKALSREFSDLVTEKPGTIMRQEVLESYNKSIDYVYEKFGSRFRRIEKYDTTDEDASLVSYNITENVLTVLEDLVTEKIGYCYNTFTNLFKEKDGVNDFLWIENRVIFYNKRMDVEKDINNIQPIPIAVITNKTRDRLLVLKKNETKTLKDSPEHNRMLAYLGGHIRIEDKMSEQSKNIDIIRTALEREILEELGIRMTIGNQIPFLIYTPISDKSRKHIAVCFVLELDSTDKKFRPTREEFISKHEGSKSGTMINLKEAGNMFEQFEPWSRHILSHVFGIKNTLF